MLIVMATAISIGYLPGNCLERVAGCNANRHGCCYQHLICTSQLNEVRCVHGLRSTVDSLPTN